VTEYWHPVESNSKMTEVRVSKVFSRRSFWQNGGILTFSGSVGVFASALVAQRSYLLISCNGVSSISMAREGQS
jgi:hypothetical protein